MTLSDKEYRALAVESFSSIKHLLESPKTFLYYKNKPFQGSTSTLLGTAVHHYLQGNRHLVTFSIVDKRKKEEYARFEQEFFELAGDEGIIVPKSFEDKINNIMVNFNSNAKAVQLVEGCTFEAPYFFEVNGINLKGKVDGVGKDYLLEIKTSSQATTSLEFQEEAKDRHYDMQAYMYGLAHYKTTGTKLKHYFLVVNTQAPYKVSVYKSSDIFILEGEKKLNEALTRYKKYIINNENFDEDVEEI